MKLENVLVVVSETDASHRAVEYIGRILGNSSNVDIHLVFFGTNLPPELLEFGGSETPETEERLDNELHERQRRWIAVADEGPEAVLDGARDLLRRSGVEASRISTCVSSPLDHRTDADEILLLAQDEQCDTVVVGQGPSDERGRKLAQSLMRRADGHAIWIVN